MLKRIFTIALLATVLAVNSNTAAAGVQSSIGGGATSRGPYPPRPTPTPQPHPPKPQHDRWIGPCQGWRLGENILTPADWDGDRSVRMMQRLIACSFAIYAPGQSAYAMAIADRESSFYIWAKNPASSASGLFQHLASYWPSRATLLKRGWFGKGAWPASVFDPRAQALVTAMMVGPEGNWSPWSM